MKGCRFSLFAILVLSFSITLYFYVHSTVKKQVTLIEFWPPRVATVSNQPLVDLNVEAARLYDEILNKYPHPTGLSRILPWNWNGKPTMPTTDGKKAVEALYSLTNSTNEPISSDWTAIEGNLASLGASPATTASFQNAQQKATKLLPQTASWAHLWIMGLPRSRRFVWVVYSIMIIVNFYTVSVSTQRFFRKKGLKRERPVTEYRMKANYFVILLGSFVGLGISLVSGGGSFVVLFFMAPLILGSVSWLIELIDFPPNPYVKLVDDLQPLSDGATT